MNARDESAPDASLEAALARLPREQAPPRDLWPAIERELQGARTQRPPRAAAGGPFAQARFTVAASLAALALLGALAWSLRGQGPGHAPVQGAAMRQASANYGPPDNAAYEAARAKLARASTGSPLAM